MKKFLVIPGFLSCCVGSVVRGQDKEGHAGDFAMAKGETIVQLHGIGPFEINYVNPDDDPRKKGDKK